MAERDFLCFCDIKKDTKNIKIILNMAKAPDLWTGFLGLNRCISNNWSKVKVRETIALGEHCDVQQ